MSDLALPLMPELRRTSQALTDTRIVWWMLGVLFGAVIVTTMAPGHRPGYLGWIGLIAIIVLGALGVAALAAARSLALPLSERRGQLIFALVVTLIALLISAFFGLGATIWCSLGLTVAYVAVLSEPFDGKRWLFAIALATLVPLWTWSAIDAWDARLLTLIPIGFLAHNAAVHFSAPSAPAGSPLVDSANPGAHGTARRPHLLGGLMSLLVAVALVLLVGLASKASPVPLISGATVAIVVVVLSFSIERRQGDQPFAACGGIQMGAFAVLALSLLASL